MGLGRDEQLPNDERAQSHGPGAAPPTNCSASDVKISWEEGCTQGAWPAVSSGLSGKTFVLSPAPTYCHKDTGHARSQRTPKGTAQVGFSSRVCGLLLPHRTAQLTIFEQLLFLKMCVRRHYSTHTSEGSKT